MNARAIPLSLYVHWPWCVRKCPYCDFNSHAYPCPNNSSDTQALQARYVDALIADLLTNKALVGDRELISVFFGGGTPSLLAPQELFRFMDALQRHFSLASDIEVTMEANPGTIDAAHFAAYRDLGVNRLSMGVQSFDDEKLKTLGRIHNRRDVFAALEIIHRHFDNFNLDVMYALPNQTLKDLQKDLADAIAAQSTHLSFYQLTLEPNTVFAKHTPAGLPDEDTCAAMQTWVVQTLEAAGFEHYEVSGYAKPGRRCRHNLNYWTFGDYIASGAGAHSKVTLDNGQILREARYAMPASFMEHAEKGEAVTEKRFVPKDEQAFEFMLNALRLKDGVDLATLTERTDLTLADMTEPIERAQCLKLMPEPLDRIRASNLGWQYLSDLQELFL